MDRSILEADPHSLLEGMMIGAYAMGSDEGFIYVGKVVGVSPIAVIDPVTFELTQEIELAGAASYARGAVVTPDGKGIWAGDLGGSGGPLYNWTSEDLVTYTKTDHSASWLARMVKVNEDATYTPVTSFWAPGKEAVRIIK